jgi:CHAT domain-containing protein
VGAAVAPELRDADAAARDRVAALRNRLTALASTADAAPGSIAAARADVDAAYRALEESTARVQREARRVADVVYPRSVALAELQASLGADTAMVLYHLAPAHALAVVMTRDSVRLAELGDTASLSVRVQDYVDLVSVAGSDETRKAAGLYDALLRPLEAETAGRKRILVSPDGPLALLPFEALVREDGARAERAVERWEIAYVPSATVSAVLRDGRTPAVGAGRGIVALGDPVCAAETDSGGAGLRRFGRMRRLPGTADEVRAIGALVAPDERTLLLRDAATGAALAQALARAPGRLAALHIACHGRVDTERPRLTGLVLSGGEILSVDDVYRMHVPADLVVLSACDTGRGKLLLGEGAINLARGFLFAGASRVIVSNWAVSDDATRALMVAFYGKMLTGGLAPGEALREAKLGMLRSGGASAHPAHWAAFVLWGG